MATNDFPQDLLNAQRELHQTVAAYSIFCDELPWSVDPAPGWSGDKMLYSDHYRAEFPDSPGYSEGQKAQDARFRERLIELSATVTTHPYWATLEGGVVAARMELKQVTKEPAAVDAAA
ncbi:hypothetical protein HY68_36170 [Streptomyces sp. AcH 505]|uniref:hypothetical protein n=1 Tax=Streptomyces sp. AcH 505 TaxID=352211 RepID=UPI0005922CD6|nr:hypothetical protein HY68_36170 [Streptomyces sp. AcH 505]